MLDQFVNEVSKGRKARRYLQVSDEEHPVGGPVDGRQSATISARRPGSSSAAGFDVIDINFGCPVKKVLGRSRGGYLLGQPETALEIVARVREAVPPHVPVTVKMRRGLDDTRREPRQVLSRSSTAPSRAAWRPSPCTAARSSRSTSAPAAGSFCAK